MASINTRCPIDDEDVDQSVTRVWQGQRLAFCCEECRAEWDELSDQEKQDRAMQVTRHVL
jgi:uncharacterized Zn ribbon protein